MQSDSSSRDIFRKGAVYETDTLVLVAVAMVAGVVAAWAQTSTGADAEPAPRSAKEVRGASPYIGIKNEPPPKLIVDEPLPDGLPQGIVWIQYRTENCRILPVFGKEALNAVPAGRPPARARRRPALVVGRRERHQHGRHRRDAAGRAQGDDRAWWTPRIRSYPGQSKTVKFTIPKKVSGSTLTEGRSRQSAARRQPDNPPLERTAAAVYFTCGPGVARAPPRLRKASWHPGHRHQRRQAPCI